MFPLKQLEQLESLKKKKNLLFERQSDRKGKTKEIHHLLVPLRMTTRPGWARPESAAW